MFFGLGVMPKIVVVSIVTFFLLFFNTFTGAQQFDEDPGVLDLMGATRGELFRKVVAPATAVWIAGGIRSRCLMRWWRRSRANYSGPGRGSDFSSAGSPSAST